MNTNYYEVEMMRLKKVKDALRENEYRAISKRKKRSSIKEFWINLMMYISKE